MFSGLHTASGRYYLQICLVQSFEGKELNDVSLSGSFSTKHVFPQTLSFAHEEKTPYEISPDGVLTLLSSAHTVALVCRVYSHDQR